MRREGGGILVGMLVVTNAMVAIYIGGMLWLLSVFHLDDGVALAMSTADWWLGGAIRLGLSAGVAVVLGLASYLISLAAVRVLGGPERETTRMIAVAAAGVAFSGGAVGAIQFVVTRPYFWTRGTPDAPFRACVAA